LDTGIRVIIAHDFFETFGGAERVTAEIARTFPDAPVYAILGRRSVAERMGIADRVVTLLPERGPLLHHYRRLAPMYPALLRSVRLPRADVVVASSYAYAHGFRSVNRAPVVCYCHGPFRHLWTQQESYARQLPGGRAGRIAFSGYAALARLADRAAAQSVHTYLTQSPFTAELIARVYGRSAQVLTPPIDCQGFRPSNRPHDGSFLFAGRLVEAYKRPSLVVDAFARMPDLRLRIAGDGPALAALRRRATPNVEFLGRLEDPELVTAMQSCAGAIFPSVDDYGLIPLEVNACGRPVLALRAGGARHTVLAGVSGEFIAEQSVDAVMAAVRSFDAARYDPAAIRVHALAWDGRSFRARLQASVRAAVQHAAPGAALAELAEEVLAPAATAAEALVPPATAGDVLVPPATAGAAETTGRRPARSTPPHGGNSATAAA
jgi:glycosyltransferase involved in cell wall biosynthesis